MPIPILPALLAGLLTFNAAHYWHDQLKPFKNDQERVKAVKEVLAESSFTAFWNNEDKKALVQNEKFLKIESLYHRQPGEFAVRKSSYFDDGQHILGAPECSLFRHGKNKHDIQKESDLYHVVLAHEGVHISQNLDWIVLCMSLASTPQERNKFSRSIERDADQKALYATSQNPELSSSKKLKALLGFKWIFERSCEAYHSDGWFKICEQEGSSHPPCKERVAMIEPYIQNARIEGVHETVRDEIAWH